MEQHETEKKATVCLVPRGSPTTTSELDQDQTWQHYVSSYMMTTPTKGIPLERCSKVFLCRSLPQENVYKNRSTSTVRENMRFASAPVPTYRLLFLPDTDDLMVKDPNSWAPVSKVARGDRSKAWRNKPSTLGWMQDSQPEEVQAKQREWESFLRSGTIKKRCAVEIENPEDPFVSKRAKGVIAENGVM